MKIHTRALFIMEIAAMISGQGHKSAVKSTSAGGSSLSVHFPHILFIVHSPTLHQQLR